MLALATQSTDPVDAPLTDWRPPGWIVGDVDDPYIPERVEDLYEMYSDRGYYTAGGCLTEKALALGDDDRAEIEAVVHNRRLLRDAWNTHGVVWRLAAALIGRPFRVDPFWNQGAKDLDSLAVRLDGLSPLTNGMLTAGDARAMLECSGDKLDSNTRAGIVQRLAQLGDVPDLFPLNWRQHLAEGEAAAASNGPHSCTAKWLRCSAVYGEREFSAAFVPDNGDGRFQSVALTAQLVVRLGRVPCGAPPGVKASSPRGASALCVWVPKAVRESVLDLQARVLAAKSTRQSNALTRELDALLPEPTRRVLLGGASIAVPLWKRPRSGTQYAIVQRSDLGAEPIVDFGLTDVG